ncbi:MAG TPA: polyprenol monophosphomannose synthase [bacterium]|nr:polyprenol monophosphomannose synthase [bacterium]
MKSIIIIPTYNESQNIKQLIERLLFLGIKDLHILVVDDNSPDGTADIVEKLSQKESNIYLIRRPGKAGLGTAYVAGFKFALNNGYDYIFEMDADLSHNPDEIPNFLKKIEQCDLVIGSRYATGVNVINWPLTRLILSVGANKYTKIITGMPIKDSTGGFKCFRRQVLEAIDFENISSGGYSFQIEMNFKAWKKGFRICEIPIIFTDREAGSSKMSKRIIWEAVWLVWKLKIKSLLGII